MKVLSQIPCSIDQQWARAQFDTCLYPISLLVLQQVSNLMLSGTCAVLFSGGHRLHFDATYIEPKQYQQTSVPWKPRTVFVDPSQQDLLFLVLRKMKTTNLLIINTNIFLRYRHWQSISDDITQFRTMVDRVIVTIPSQRFDYNRLRYDLPTIAQKLQGRVVDNTIIVCQ
jgi:hypothetical protein